MSLGENVPAWLNVSRETINKLRAFQDLVVKWNPAINLVAKNRIAEVWERHILDSAQLAVFLTEDTLNWCDLGSGGGFPGIVVAVLAQQSHPDLIVTMVESDQRKSVFLQQAVRHLELSSLVKSVRIESLAPQSAAIVSARALAPLADLLPHALRHLKPGGKAIFPKGSGSDIEVALARRSWTFTLTEQQSKTSADGKILVLKDIENAAFS